VAEAATKVTQSNKPQRKYLVHVRLGGREPLISRINESVPRLKRDIEEISRGNYTVAWSSEDGGTIAFFIITTLEAAQIMARIESPDKDSLFSGRKQTYRGGALIGEDQIAVLELGGDFVTRRLEQPVTWLRNR
jgi:hypothetical protein